MQFDRQTQRKIHSRHLEITTYEHAPGSVILEGRLQDECFVDRHMLTGETRPPGTIHDMIVRMQVRGVALVIEAIETEMRSVPRKECRQAAGCLKPLIGMSIASGFTVKVKEMIGGPKGCAHLVSLVLAMAPAAVQGAWSAVSQKPLDPGLYADSAMNFLTDTCMIWRKDSPLEREYRERLRALQQ